MSIIKCKMCGGDLNIIEGASTVADSSRGCLQKDVPTATN